MTFPSGTAHSSAAWSLYQVTRSRALTLGFFSKSGYPESSSGRKPNACSLNMQKLPGGSLNPGLAFSAPHNENGRGWGVHECERLANAHTGLSVSPKTDGR